jgi:hypothetical protein
MPSNIVTQQQVEHVRKAAKDSGVTNVVLAVAAACEQMATGELTEDGIHAFYAIGAARNPDWYASVENHAELIAAAFGGMHNADARAQLVKAVGEAAANEAAKTFGLKSVGDFSRPPKAPDGAKPPKAAQNPFSDDTAAGQDRRISFIKSKGTKAASSLAASVQRDIAGRPLRSAA